MSSGSDGSNAFGPSSDTQSLPAVASTSSVPSPGSSASRSSVLLPSVTTSPSPPSLLPGGPSSASPMPPKPHRLSIGAIIGIALGVFAVVLCIALALFFLLRRRAGSRRSKRMSIESSRQRLEPYSYDDDPSRPVSSVWTWFGSVSVDPDFEPQPEPSPHSLDFRFAEKDAGPGRLEAYTPGGPSPCPSPAVAETQPLARDASVHSLHEGLAHLNVPASSALDASSSSELLALAGTDYAVAHPLNRREGGLERSASGVSRTTATSTGEVQSVEAL